VTSVLAGDRRIIIDTARICISRLAKKWPITPLHEDSQALFSLKVGLIYLQSQITAMILLRVLGAVSANIGIGTNPHIIGGGSYLPLSVFRERFLCLDYPHHGFCQLLSLSSPMKYKDQAFHVYNGIAASCKQR